MAVTTINSRYIRPQLLAALALPFVLSQAHAAAWLIKPSLEARETYSDNASLSASGEKQGDFITEYRPRVIINGVGRRLKLNADYTLDALFFMRSKSQNNIQHQLFSDMNAELLDDLLYFDGRASISQANVDPFGAQVSTNSQAGANRAEVRTLSMSPYVRHRFGRLATGELRYGHDIFNSSNNELSNTTSDRASFTLGSGTAFSSLGWGLQANRQESKYASTGGTSTSMVSGNLSYALTPGFSLTASGGNEQYKYSSQDGSGGPMWNGGFAWHPSTRTSLTANTGRRFYGPAYRLDASYRTRLSVWSVSYKEEVSTTQSQFQLDSAPNTANFLDGLWKTSIPDAAARRDIVDAFIQDTGLPRTINGPVNSFTNRFFLQKSLLASVALNGIKNTVVVNAFDTKRVAQGGVPAATLPVLGPRALLDADDSRQVGVNGLWRYRLSSNLNANLSVAVSRTSSDSLDRIDKNQSVRLALTHQFSRKLKGSLELRRLQTDSTVASAATRENALAASFIADF
jgi:uncharacterized protein (PEP-CTERM system associated)